MEQNAVSKFKKDTCGLANIRGDILFFNLFLIILIVLFYLFLI
jgi:hypothetical protein